MTITNGKFSLNDLRERFSCHTTWHCYRNNKTKRVFATPNEIKFDSKNIVKIGVAHNCCHKTAVRIAKGKP